MSKSFPFKAFITIYLFFIPFNYSYAQVLELNRVNGVTLDAVDHLNQIVTALRSHKVTPTARIVFDEWVPAADYTRAVNKISTVSKIMGEILDSYYMHQYSVQQYVDRTNEYLDKFQNKVDIWEIGNEINGEWLGNNADVVAKMTQAFNIVKSRNKKAALTLYYNHDCWEHAQNEMFRWTLNNVPQNMRNGLDYVLVSYYEDDCNSYQPNWQAVFDSLHVIFPNSRLGIGECGTSHANRKEEYINRYYRMQISTPNYIGGYFWWYYKQDCVPKTKSLWNVIDRAMAMLPLQDYDNIAEGNNIYNYPNPFNPKTTIKYNLTDADFVKLSVFDELGREVKVLVNEYRQPGSYSVDFDGSGYSSGVYYYVLQRGKVRHVNKMVLVK